MSPRTRPAQRGFSLSEVMVASAIFLFIALAAFSLFDDANKVHKKGSAAAELQQRTRLAFDVMMDELRLAGFDYDRDGSENSYPDHPDEQIEYAGPHAITFRGNLDFGDGTSGREPALEIGEDHPDFGTVCCPMVTTGNDEIITYALRSDNAARNTGSIVVNLDRSIPRDGGWDGAGLIENEETIRIENVDLTVANPPYTLMRFSLDEAGQVVEQPFATGIRSMTFTYAGGDGNEFTCTTPEADGSCLGGNQKPFTELLGSDDIATGDGKGRTGRAAIRRIELALVGMGEHDEMRYVDGSDPVMPGRRKLALTATVMPQNLGLKGSPDLEDREAVAPTNVQLCVGQCNTVRVEWDEVPLASGYFVKLFTAAGTEPFFTGATPGITVVGSFPPRVYAVYQRIDAAQLVEGASIRAVVQVRSNGDEVSEDSQFSSTARIIDVVRLEAPPAVRASGYNPYDGSWPDVSLTLPDTANLSGTGAQANQILVSWEAPRFTLNVTDPTAPETTWTTRVGSGTEAPLSCDAEWVDSDEDGVVDGQRTRIREQVGTVRYLVFRSTNPRFVPSAADFVTATVGDVDAEVGRVSYLDQTVHAFTNGAFNSTSNAIENCTTYYYRVRAVDDCWDGTNPAGPADLHKSPFSPALNPNTGASDSDDVTTVSADQVGLAVPGFAVPQATPRAPKDLRFTRYDRRTDDGDGKDAVVGFDATKLDNMLDGLGQPAYDDIAISDYRLYSGPTATFTLADALNEINGVRYHGTIGVRDLKAGRIAYDDENGDGNITTGEDEAWPPATGGGVTPVSGLRVDMGDGSQRFWKLLAVQCRDEETWPDPAEPAVYDNGALSEAVKFPCDFGGGPFSNIELNIGSFPTSVTATAYMQDLTVAGRHARLILKDPVSGDRVMTAMPGVSSSLVTAGVYRVTFNSTHIAALTDNFGSGNYRISVEWTDANECVGLSDAQDQIVDLPSCCLAQGTPGFSKVSTTRIVSNVVESCGVTVRINKITLFVDNANGGGPDRFSTVKWNGTTIWTGNLASVVIDRSADPLPVTMGASGALQMDMSRSVVGDNIMVTYDYKVGGLSGTCTYTWSVP